MSPIGFWRRLSLLDGGGICLKGLASHLRLILWHKHIAFFGHTSPHNITDRVRSLSVGGGINEQIARWKNAARNVCLLHITHADRPINLKLLSQQRVCLCRSSVEPKPQHFRLSGARCQAGAHHQTHKPPEHGPLLKRRFSTNYEPRARGQRQTASPAGTPSPTWGN